MAKEEYLSEEKYQKTKKKITTISLIILIIGLLVGGWLIVLGVISQNNAKKTNDERYAAAYKESQDSAADANARLAEIGTKKEEINNQIETKEYACNSLDMKSSSWYADRVKCQEEVSSLRTELGNLEQEEFRLKNFNYTVYYTPVAAITYLKFYYIGGSVILFTCMISGCIYFIAKRREITAFTAQQVMPIAQEGIEKMTPTIANAAGGIAKEVSKGIKDGMSDNTDSNK